ncbi:MAG TPA: YceI family protein [Polyangiaceae bacterium]|nr:YceI family protein [Polyangiaceae bacterium]
MNRSIASVAAAFALAVPSLAAAAPFECDPAHTTALFSVKHMMITNVRGEFGKVACTLDLDEKDPTKSTVEATIDVASLSTRNEKRDTHLKSADFFDAAKFPTITFKSTKVTRAGKGRWKVQGDLTMHGVTKPVTLDVTGPSAEEKDPMGNTKVGFLATGKVNREDYGLKWNVPLSSGGVLVGKDVAIEIDAELLKKTAPNAESKQGAENKKEATSPGKGTK